MNIEGQRYGRLTVIKRDISVHPSKTNGYYWLCKCDCGNEKVVRQCHLRAGKTASCGCLAKDFQQTPRIDMSGKKFGKLLVLKYFGSSGGDGAIWLCICKCGNEKKLSAGQLNAGGFQSCGKCRRISWSGYGDISGWYWNTLKRNAKKRQMIFDLAIEDAWSLFQNQKGKCALTGVDISFPKSGGWKNRQTASLDRINSSFGYTKDNIQWLHKDCNFAKSYLTPLAFDRICLLRTIQIMKHNNMTNKFINILIKYTEK